MLDLTPEQQQSVTSGDAVPIKLNETDCVVVRKDVFDRMKHVAYDDSEWTPEEMSAAAMHAFDSADNDGPIP